MEVPGGVDGKGACGHNVVSASAGAFDVNLNARWGARSRNKQKTVDGYNLAAEIRGGAKYKIVASAWVHQVTDL